jgi:hypothetical protein
MIITTQNTNMEVVQICGPTGRFSTACHTWCPEILRPSERSGNSMEGVVYVPKKDSRFWSRAETVYVTNTEWPQDLELMIEDGR